MKIVFTEDTMSDYHLNCEKELAWRVSNFSDRKQEITISAISEDRPYIRHFYASNFRNLIREGIIKIVKE
jgi:hypothetical protein